MYFVERNIMSQINFKISSLGLNQRISELLPQKDSSRQSNPFAIKFNGGLKADTFQRSNQADDIKDSQNFVNKLRAHTDNIVNTFNAKYSQAVTFAGNLKTKTSDAIMSLMPPTMRVSYLSNKSVTDLGNMLNNAVTLSANA